MAAQRNGNDCDGEPRVYNLRICSGLVVGIIVYDVCLVWSRITHCGNGTVTVVAAPYLDSVPCFVYFIGLGA